MSDLFSGFTEEVCRFVKHATPTEKKEIGEELRAHMATTRPISPRMGIPVRKPRKRLSWLWEIRGRSERR